MIKAQLQVIQDLAFFTEFYLRFKAAGPFFEQNSAENLKCLQKTAAALLAQDPVYLRSAVIRGHAVKSSQKEQNETAVTVCASVSILCKSLSSLLGRNLAGIISIAAPEEGHFECKLQARQMLNTLDETNFHHYVEAFGAMKNFILGLKLLAQNYPSTIELIVNTKDR